MQFWEYVLTADQQLDLAQPSKALTWLHEQPWGIRGEWTPETKSKWIHNVLTLRSLARRLKSKRLRRPAPKGEENDCTADYTAFGYLKLMHSCIMASRGGPLSSRSFRGLGLLPTYALPSPMPMDLEGKTTIRRLAIEISAESENSDAQRRVFFWRDDGDVFWQIVFHSLFADSGPALCRTCGAALGNSTPTGRKKKQTQCGRCRYKAWYRQQPAEMKRKRWRHDYRKRK